jgi:hypothetical protein
MSNIDEMMAEIDAANEVCKQARAVERSAWVHREEARKVWLLAYANSTAASAQMQRILDKAQAEIDARKAARA